MKGGVIRDFYKKMLGYYPYLYQEKVFNSILEGKNIILAVPTGAGKTLASIMPFLYARENPEIHFPKKMIYSLPLRSLANSIYEDVFEVLRRQGISEEDIKRQTGEFSNDKYFEKDIIFSTIDQTLSNFLCFPLPLSPRQANVNAGAMVGSYLVFDEFHLLDEERAMATTLGSLRMLGNLCRCCIMTATLSGEYMEALKANLPNYEIITLDEFPDDRKQVSSLLPEKNKKTIRILNQTISAKKIANKHNNKTIVICNRVETAQKIYQELNGLNLSGIKNLTGLRLENIICLHSRFFDEDRKAKEGRLKQLFGKDANKSEGAILIATQVIEAGMDISCDVMHTEVSPVNSFLQRAGRCARFKDEIGEIFVYDILEIEEKEKIQLEPESAEDKAEIRKLNNRFLPYEKELCQNTLKALQQYTTLDGDIPQKLIEEVLKEKELKLIEQLKVCDFNRDKIQISWADCQKNNYRATVRDIQSVEITIINDGQLDEVAKFPYRYQSLGMYKFSLVGWLNKIAKENLFDSEEDWLVKKLAEADNIFLENDEDEKWELKTIPVDEFKNIPTQVYLNARFFGYSPDFGFNWQYRETFNKLSPEREWKEKEGEFKPLKKDTFYQHNKALIGAFEKEFLGENQDKLDFTFVEIAKFIANEELQKKDFIRLIKLMIVLHDYGKLNNKWQKPMQTYQALKEGIDPKNFKEVLGHTDFDKNKPEDIALEKKSNLKNRGRHAGVGAFMALSLLGKEFEAKNDFLKILSPLATAIMRHHSPLTSKVNAYKISDVNFQAFIELYEKEIGVFSYLKAERLQKYYMEKDLKKYLANEANTTPMIVYFFYVRILRICDQKATVNKNKYLPEHLKD
ncbi:MAG: CRISPR-associated helicase Cas3' [Cyclobacteriaceae bacterium]|nr:CRISPR-associated helicase Cas3' [Cyclobacteriaceae bacterium]MCH8515410.1 CRISPR-associated helicase Cas3' [Cyclobacteriaceae bacterium]